MGDSDLRLDRGTGLDLLRTEPARLSFPALGTAGMRSSVRLIPVAWAIGTDIREPRRLPAFLGTRSEEKFIHHEHNYKFDLCTYI